MVAPRQRKARVCGQLWIFCFLDYRLERGEMEKALNVAWAGSVVPAGPNGQLRLHVHRDKPDDHSPDWGQIGFRGEAFSEAQGLDILAWWFRLVEEVEVNRNKGVEVRGGSISIAPTGGRAILANPWEEQTGSVVIGDDPG
jgi:hypothetical protein